MTYYYWERQEKESDKAYVAFSAFRDLGPERRTIPATALIVHGEDGKRRARVSLMERWAKQHNWRDRAKAYDEELNRKQRMELEEDRAKARKRRLDLARMQLVIGAKRLEALIREIEVGGAGATKNAVALLEAAKLIEAGAKLERLELGEADVTRIEHTGDGLRQDVVLYLPDHGRPMRGQDGNRDDWKAGRRDRSGAIGERPSCDGSDPRRNC